MTALEAALDAAARVASWSRSTFNRLVLDGAPVPAVGVERRADAVTPTIVEGRAPLQDDDVALGGRTMQRLGVSIGDTVTVSSVTGETSELEVVGRAAFPGLGAYSGSERTELGTGAMSTIATLRTFGTPVDKGQVLVRVVPSTDRAEFERDLESVLLDAGESDDEIAISIQPKRPSDIVALAGVRRAPWALAALLAALLVVQLVITLFAASRGRRHDLALLKTVGFLRRQVAATVSWQTATFAAIALLIGVPVGIALGRALWTSLSDRLGVVPDPVTPLVGLLILAAATLVVGGLLSYGGGAVLARTRPAAALRSE